jgi:hypothetical protein
VCSKSKGKKRKLEVDAKLDGIKRNTKKRVATKERYLLMSYIYIYIYICLFIRFIHRNDDDDPYAFKASEWSEWSEEDAKPDGIKRNTKKRVATKERYLLMSYIYIYIYIYMFIHPIHT